jgi:ferredoxin-NADP reductase
VSQRIECTVAGSVQRAPGIESFRFTPAEPVAFVPGQYVQVLFDPERQGNKDLNKFLSLSCAPGKGYLEVTKKLSASEFSGRLHGLRPGQRVLLRGPFGDCVLREGDRKAAFLAGGIGITPVISMVEHAVANRPDLAMELLYTNRVEEEFAFKAELEAWVAANPRLSLRLFLTAGTPQDPRIASGRITRERLAEALPEPASWTCFIFGPPPMVAAMRTTCLEVGVPEAQVRTEGFLGY